MIWDLITKGLTVNWKAYGIVAGVFALAGAGLTGWLAWELHTGSVARLEAKHAAALQTALTEQKTTLQAECAKDKQITMEVSNETQSRLADLREQLAAVKRVQPNRCVPTPARPTGGADAATADAQLRQQNGVYSDTIFDFSGEVERDAGIPIDKLQHFVCRVWKERGQPLDYPVCK